MTKFTLKAMPGTPMTQAEMQAQCEAVSEVAAFADKITEFEEQFIPEYQERVVAQRDS